MISGSTSALHLAQIAAGLPVSAKAISSAMCRSRRFFRGERRYRHQLQPVGLGVAGDEIEDARHVAPDRRIGGEKRNVGVDARGDGMIIAGAEVAVGDQRAAFSPHHHRQFGVGLQFDEAEHDLRAGAFEIARPADIRLLVEARLQFDERGDRLAGFGRLDQRAHDRAVGRGAIERLLDRDDVRDRAPPGRGTARRRRRIRKGGGRRGPSAGSRRSNRRRSRARARESAG